MSNSHSVPLFTICRTSGSLLFLLSYMDENNQTVAIEFQSKIRNLLTGINGGESIWPFTIDAGLHNIHGINQSSIGFIVVTHKSVPSQQAFSFLQMIKDDFLSKYGLDQLESAIRPYQYNFYSTFVETQIGSLFNNKFPSNQSNPQQIDPLNQELRDVQKLMYKNIDDVLQRGENLDMLGEKAIFLQYNAEKYKKDAKNLNLQAVYLKYGLIAFIVIFLLLLIRLFLF